MAPNPPADTPRDLRRILSRHYSDKIEQMLRAEIRAEQWEALKPVAVIGVLLAAIAWLSPAWFFEVVLFFFSE